MEIKDSKISVSSFNHRHILSWDFFAFDVFTCFDLNNSFFFFLETSDPQRPILVV